MEHNSAVAQQEESLTPRELSQILNRPLRSTYRWIHRKPSLHIRRVGRRIFVNRHEVGKLLADVEHKSPEHSPAPSEAVTGGTSESIVAPIEPAANHIPEQREPSAPARAGTGQRELFPPRADRVRVAFLCGYDFMM